MTSAFDQAASRLGQRTHELAVAGRRVRVRFAGPALKHLIRPLAHLELGGAAHPADDSGLEILVWESTTSGIMPPPPPWNRSQVSYRGEITGLPSERISVNFNGEQCLVSLFHRPSQRAIFWIRDAADLPYWETCAPFRTLFHWWSQTFGGQIAHAAAVGRDGEGVLLVGRGGRGKSTTAAACVDAGMEYVGDDYILLTREPRPTAHSLYNCAKIHSSFLRLRVAIVEPARGSPDRARSQVAHLSARVPAFPDPPAAGNSRRAHAANHHFAGGQDRARAAVERSLGGSSFDDVSIARR